MKSITVPLTLVALLSISTIGLPGKAAGKELATNLIQNPSFEDGLRAWTGEGAKPERHHKTILNVTPEGGDYYAELASDKGYRLIQRVPTEKGRAYTLRFHAQARPRVNRKESRFIVMIDGRKVTELLPEFGTWSTHTYVFETLRNETEIAFEDLHFGAAGIGAMIDQVSVVPSPNGVAPSQDLFDGKTLVGWKLYGGKQEFTVEDGMIVGTTVLGEGNGFLSTTKAYKDFELSFEVKMDVGMNSGCQIRSVPNPKSSDGHLMGPQVEIGGRSGFIFGEHNGPNGRHRGWIVRAPSVFKDQAKATAFNNGQWNHYRVVAQGPRIRTWINGVAIADVVDQPTDLKGLIGLQVHSIKNKNQAGKSVRWRNITLRPLGEGKAEDGDWTSIFNGKDLDGWVVKCRPNDKDKRDYWKVVDGAITAQTPPNSNHHYIWLLTEREYGDFELRLKVQTTAGTTGNSGIQVRSRYDDEAGWLDGPQVDIHPRGPWRCGFIYDETRGARVWLWPDVGHPANAKPSHAPQGWKWFHAGEDDRWNDVRIFCQGTRIRTIVNGVEVADYDGKGLLDDAAHRKRNVGLSGHIGLQIHPGGQMRIRFKDIAVREERRTTEKKEER